MYVRVIPRQGRDIFETSWTCTKSVIFQACMAWCSG